jgi:hypothetical protein
MKVEDILGKKCCVYVRDLVDVYNIDQEKDPSMLTKIVGHLYLAKNRFIFYFNWISELNKKEIMYPCKRSSLVTSPHNYDSFVELPGWKVTSSIMFLENEKALIITAEEIKEMLNVPKDTLVQIKSDACLGAMGYGDRENTLNLFKPISKRIVNI